MSERAGSAPLPEGTVTFLFSDIEGSTSLLERHGAAVGQLLARHHVIVEEVVSRHRGRIFETVGDAVYAAFSRAADAAGAALDVHGALAAEDWGPLSRLAVRIALHTGAVDRRDDHYFGPALFRASRLLVLAYGEQTLLSSVTAQLVAGDLPDGASLRELGSHRLKDLGEPEQVFQLVHPAQRAEFPPLRSLDLHPHNLPVQLTRFVGREADLLEIGQLVREHRLSTLLGPGGMGKTRLALQVAAEQLEHFADGVFFVDLAPHRDPERLFDAVARTLAVREQAGFSIADALREHLQSRALLLVLDNLEQLLPDAGATIAELLAMGPELRILATSRMPVRIRGEREYQVPPMDAGRDDRLEPTMPPAVALFVDRARAMNPSFAVDDRTGPLIAEVCRRLDGLPLAIELAVARLRSLSLEQLRDRLSTRLPLLTGGARDLPERQQTLHRTIGWSEELLSPADRQLLAQLGVFVGGFTLEAAEAVTDDHAAEVLDGVTRLVEASLVGTSPADRRPRYRMLETIREYALEALHERGDLTSVRRRHAAYFTGLVEAEAPLLAGAGAVEAHATLHANVANVTSALTAHQQSEDWPSLASVAGQLGPFWRWDGRLAEGRRWLELALEHRDALGPPLLADVYWSLGILSWAQGDYEEAASSSRLELALARRLRDKRRQARVKTDLASYLAFAGHYEGVETLFREAMTSAEQLADGDLLERLRVNFGRFLGLRLGRDAEATELLDAARDSAEASGDRLGLAFTLVNLGEVANRHARYGDARPALERGRALAAEIENRHLLAGAELDLGELEVAQGNLGSASAWLESALRTFMEMGEKTGVLECVEQIAFGASHSGDHVRAVRLLGAADRLRSATPVGYRPRKASAYESVRRQAADVLGEAAETEWVRGQRMSFAEVAADALEGLAAIPEAV